ncbi:hypothetical protein CNMCM5623_004903 [Aspergillus felis]|uniref:Altered inheritance of mitochondria protein 9, mitochondrial n=1 Tax=Aspergillus felis TaxID=1287682 RepID=A0A8H6VAN0_9EURO|nr:hypothetical protein CNMCM5623_004903 [Aspergillus felis]KAF7184165.1 hypothetical protein CNMCM7691_004790 [Aspergillus felis]
MEEATGWQLGGIWDDLNLADKLKIVEEIVAIERSSYLYHLRVADSQNHLDAHNELYSKFLHVPDYLLPNNKELNRSTIWHWDIHAPNLFVEGHNVTGLIDWQGVWAGRLFFQARRPKLVAYNGEIMLEFPENYKDIEDKYVRAWIWAQVYLIRVARHWYELNHEVACPNKFTDEELKTHYREGEGWNEQADFWDALRGFVDRDGWTSNEDYERALETFAELRELGLQALTGDERLHF